MMIRNMRMNRKRSFFTTHIPCLHFLLYSLLEGVYIQPIVFDKSFFKAFIVVGFLIQRPELGFVKFSG